MRLAGTWSRYSNSAMPQLASAAMNQGFEERFFRCAYQANVMKTFDRTSSPADCVTTDAFIAPRSVRRIALQCRAGSRAPGRAPEFRSQDRFRPGAPARNAVR